MAYVQAICALFGFFPAQAGTGLGSLNLNSASNYVAFQFTAQASVALSAFRFWLTSVVHGTGGTITCKVYGDSANAPNLGGGAIDTLTVGALSANSFINCTGGTVALTRGTRYWIVITNADAAPATNFIAVAFVNNATGGAACTDGASATSANAGSTWSITTGSFVGRCQFSDGNYFGYPFNGTSILTGTQGVYSTQVIGTRFTTPANAKPIVAGLASYWTVGGTPTGNLLMSLYDASHNLLASTFAIPNATAKAATTAWESQLFDPSTIAGGASTVTLSPNTTYTVGLTESTNSDTSSNQFRPYSYTWDTDVNSLPLIPWSMQQDIYNGTSWTQTQGQFSPFALLLASGGEFASAGGSTIITPPSRLTIVRGFNPKRDRVVALPGAVTTQTVPLPVLRPRFTVRTQFVRRQHTVPIAAVQPTIVPVVRRTVITRPTAPRVRTAVISASRHVSVIHRRPQFSPPVFFRRSPSVVILGAAVVPQPVITQKKFVR